MAVTTREESAEAWGLPSRREPRWPASLAAVCCLALYITLPERLTLGPSWLFPVLESILLVPLNVVWPHRRSDEPPAQRAASIVMIAVVNAANGLSLALLVLALIHGSQAGGGSLLLAAAQIWVTNILVFALWYWELDRGGPSARMRPNHREPDFLFPQMATPRSAPPGWTPGFVDYLFVAFTNATAFSPTDTLPLTSSAKLLMLAQAFASLLTVALVAGRAVNILGGGGGGG